MVFVVARSVPSIAPCLVSCSHADGLTLMHCDYILASLNVVNTHSSPGAPRCCYSQLHNDRRMPISAIGCKLYLIQPCVIRQQIDKCREYLCTTFNNVFWDLYYTHYIGTSIACSMPQSCRNLYHGGICASDKKRFRRVVHHGNLSCSSGEAGS